jgi:hypothetical protein
VTFNTIAMVVPRLSAIHAISTMSRLSALVDPIQLPHHRSPRDALVQASSSPFFKRSRIIRRVLHHVMQSTTQSYDAHTDVHHVLTRHSFVSHLQLTPAPINRTSVVTQPTHGPASPLFRAALTAQSSHSNSLVDPLPF